MYIVDYQSVINIARIRSNGRIWTEANPTDLLGFIRKRRLYPAATNTESVCIWRAGRFFPAAIQSCREGARKLRAFTTSSYSSRVTGRYAPLSVHGYLVFH